MTKMIIKYDFLQVMLKLRNAMHSKNLLQSRVPANHIIFAL